MNSLKSKFGKFAVSNKMASQVVGGTQHCCGADLCRTDQATADRLCRLAGRLPSLPQGF